MSFSRLNPTEWLSKLNQTLLAAKCRYKGVLTEFETGLKYVDDIFSELKQEDKTIWWAGNGGSAAICSHLSQDVLNKLKIKSFHCGDTSLMTCMTNDFGYENVYARPLDTLARKGDLLIAISSSGNSENILKAAGLAKKKEMKLITLSGMSETNRLWALDHCLSFYVDSSLYGIVEVSHEAILHAAIETHWFNTACSNKADE